MTAAEARRYRNSPDPRVASEAERVLAAKAARSRRVAPKRGRAPGATKEERRTAHRMSTGELRAIVAERMAGKCESCWREVGTAWDMHHVESGGSRRPKQRAGNVLGICWECHRGAHRGDLGVLNRIAVALPLDAEARRAANHRLAKIEEARGVAVRVEVR